MADPVRELPGPRILYIITNPVSTRLLKGQLKYLSERGYRVHIASAPGRQLAEFAATESATPHALPLARQPSLSDLRALLAALKLIRSLRPTVVNASTPKAGLVGMLAAWLSRAPVRMYTVRGLRFETLTGARRTFMKLLERLTIACSTHVVFNSDSLLKVAESEGLIEVGTGVVLGGGGNGVDLARFGDGSTKSAVRRDLGIPQNTCVLGFVGRLVRDKGVADLLAVFADLSREQDALCMLIVGEFEDGDPVAPGLRKTIEDNDRIVRTGWVEDPASLYAAMDLFIFPSYREGLPNGPLEAQASGVPVVGYACTGTVDAVLDGVTGVLVPIGDVVALSASVRSLIGAQEQREQMAERGKRWVAEEFSQSVFWARLEDFLRDAIGASSDCSSGLAAPSERE